MSQPVSKFTYGDFEIEYCAFFLPELNKWQPILTLARATGGAVPTRPRIFTGFEEDFDTAADATEWARNRAIQWIDDADPCMGF